MKLDRITINRERMNGQPCIRNLRLTVRQVIKLLAIYPDRSELRQEFPELEDEDIRQALIFASRYLGYSIFKRKKPGSIALSCALTLNPSPRSGEGL
jgi:uncharacterized protein (DUF433 family)